MTIYFCSIFFIEDRTWRNITDNILHMQDTQKLFGEFCFPVEKL